MSRSPEISHTLALVPTVGRLCGFLNEAARERVAGMAVAMREAALNDEACQAHHLRAAGFSAVEIGLAWPLARRVLERADGRAVADDTPAFTDRDVAHLRRFNAMNGLALAVGMAA